MNTWFQLLQDDLKLTWPADGDQAVPFALTGIPGEDWRAVGVEQDGDERWVLEAHHSIGLEATWTVQRFGDTRAMEVWGAVTHRGHAPTGRVTEALTLDLCLPLEPAFGQPWVRSINGVRILPNTFPPHDFGMVDRQLIDTPQVFTGLHLFNEEGGRSSGETIPCMIVTDEMQQRGFALFLEWSGLWRISLRQDPRTCREEGALRRVHLEAGLRGLCLKLRPGQTLPLPRVLLTAFDGDLEAGGNALRRHIRRHVTPKLGSREPLPPTSFNHWFAFQNDYSADLLKPAVEASAAAGLEYFCVDGGWYADGFRKGIGNWSEGDPEKFPEGIKAFSDFVRSYGLKYGTWFEPEWAHEESALFRNNPEWFHPSPPDRCLRAPPVSYLQTPQSAAYFSGDFHLMDFGLAEVRRWWVERFLRAYEEWGMRWVRWDFNQAPRPNWEVGVADGDIGWRQIEHVTGLYETLDRILEACPDLLIEQCAGGGHRIDLGTVRRGHAFWMNDHTTRSDLVRFFQHGLNRILPGNYPNTNLCQARHDFTEYDFLSHSCGGFGYSGRLWEAPRADFERYRQAVSRFRQFRPLLMGDFHCPTGQPQRTTDHARVELSEGGERVVMEFNPEGRIGEASCRRE